MGLFVVLALAASAPLAGAALSPGESLTYIPYGFVHNLRPASLIDETLAELDSYGVGQALLPMPKFKRDGTLRLPKHFAQMVPLWVQRTAVYDEAHGTAITLGAVFNGRVKGASLDLELPSTRANIIAAIEPVVALGIGAVQLDLEPYPRTAGFLALLEELDAMLARRGFAGRVSVTAPATTSVWSPSYLGEVSALVSQLDPLFYDGEFTTVAGYERWVREGLSYYAANSAPATRLVPVLPSYGPNRWHRPEIEDIATASTAVGEALEAGTRVDGAGMWSWWGFFYDEEGAYEAAADRAAWQSQTRALAFTP